jgi:tripartite-type tricarboxylate transporter receptor subunit TctC
VNAILELDEAVKLLGKDGVAPAGGPPERLHALVARETATWHKVVEQAGMKAE